MLNVVTTPRDLVGEVGDVLTRHPDVRKISFTGSTAVGKKLLAQSADTVKRTSMELGGNAPFVASDLVVQYLCVIQTPLLSPINSITSHHITSTHSWDVYKKFRVKPLLLQALTG